MHVYHQTVLQLPRHVVEHNRLEPRHHREPTAVQQRQQRRLRLQQRHVFAEAKPGPCVEGREGKVVNVGGPTVQPAFRLELGGIRAPHGLQAVRHVRRKPDHLAGSDREARREGGVVHSLLLVVRHGGVQTDGLQHHGLRHLRLVLDVVQRQALLRVACEALGCLGCDTLLPLRVLAEELHGAGERCRGGVAAGNQHVDDEVPDALACALRVLLACVLEEEADQRVLAAELVLHGALSVEVRVEHPVEEGVDRPQRLPQLLLPPQVQAAEHLPPRHQEAQADEGLGGVERLCELLVLLGAGERVDVAVERGVVDAVEGVGVEKVLDVDGGVRLHHPDEVLSMRPEHVAHPVTQPPLAEQTRRGHPVVLPQLPVHVEDAVAEQLTEALSKVGALFEVRKVVLQEELDVGRIDDRHARHAADVPPAHGLPAVLLRKALRVHLHGHDVRAADDVAPHGACHAEERLRVGDHRQPLRGARTDAVQCKRDDRTSEQQEEPRLEEAVQKLGRADAGHRHIWVFNEVQIL
eukprot:Rhum_TRINITY_DN8474_c0_g1::Rhum_TRINITY_DN8474_c0_g1_i1::g.27927::m.27927